MGTDRELGQEMSEVTADTGKSASSTPYSFDDVFKLWSKYEDVAMHFNDLILRLRFQALAGVAGLTTLVGVFGRDVDDPTVRSAVVSGVFALLAFFWVAIWALDRFYYDKLLCGAVHALLKLERLSAERPDHLKIDLSSDIERSFLRAISLQHPGRRKDGRSWFYGIVFFALVLGAVSHLLPLADWALQFVPSVPALPVPPAG